MSRCFALIACAGSGTRFEIANNAAPKQYWPLNDQPIVWHSLNTFVKHNSISNTTLILSPDDTYFAKLTNQPHQYDSMLFSHPLKQKWQTYYGGGSKRCESVMNGLNFLANTQNIKDQDWVLVHDAARPGLSDKTLTSFIRQIKEHSVGGILAMPVVDSLKKSNANFLHSIDRQEMWQAQTPQMFRFHILLKAMQRAIDQKININDEAEAIELLGLKSLLIIGELANMKITYPNDLLLVETLMQVSDKYIHKSAVS